MDIREEMKNKDIRKNCIRWVSWVPVLIMMIIIFLYSAKPAQVSDGTSTPIANAILKVWEAFFGNIKETQRPEWLNTINFIVRKVAHITEYMVLALCMSWPLWRLKLRGKKLFFVTFLSCVAYAGTDEFHQLFIEGRSGSLKDVGIDSIGCAVGALLFCCVLHRIQKGVNKREP